MLDEAPNDQILRPGQVIRPKVNDETAVNLLRRLYGLKAKCVCELNAYDDKNFHIVCEEENSENPWITEYQRDGYVMKITNSLDSQKLSFIEGQTALLIFLNDNRINVPLPVKNLKGSYYSLETLEKDTEAHVVRLLTYKPGTLLLNVEVSDELLLDVGNFVARLDNVLKNFHHASYEDNWTVWMLNSVSRLRDFVYVIENVERKRLVNEVIEKFDNIVIGNLDILEKGIIHGDLNEQNILVDKEGKKLIAVIDVGDSQNSCFIFELAIALCYMLLRADNIERGKYVIKGYENQRKLTEFEKKILKLCVCARLCQSLVLGVYSHRNDPNNYYLLGTQKSGWILLEKLWSIDDEKISNIWQLDNRGVATHMD